MQLRKIPDRLQRDCYRIRHFQQSGEKQVPQRVPESSERTHDVFLNETRFNALAEAFKRPLFGFFFRLYPDRELAETLAIETFLRVYRTQTKHNTNSEFQIALYRVAIEIAFRQERCAQMSNVKNQQPTSNSQAIMSDRERAIRRSVAALPSRERIAVLLHKYQGMTVSQIALILSLSEPAANSALLRAYELLRDSLSEIQ